MRMFSKILVALFAVIFFVGQAFAQKDSTLPAIQITSAFKPVLRNAVKSDFSATPMPADTVRIVQPYIVPAQNLFYSYQPVAMQPLALNPDTTLNLGSRAFVKAGFGNYSTPLVQAGLSIGNGRTSLLNFTADYISSNNNKLEHQNFSKLKFGAAGSYFSAKNEFYGVFNYAADRYNLFGYDHSLFNFKSEDVRQQFSDITLKAGVKNSKQTAEGFMYNPNIAVNFFSYLNKLSETSFGFVLPVEKQISDQLTAKLSAEGDITNFKTDKANSSKLSFSNNLFQLKPGVSFGDGDVKVNAGLVLAWDNNAFATMPNIFAEAKIPELPFKVLGGYVGRIRKNTFRSLINVNPFLTPVYNQLNTRETEIFGGIKTTIAKHFTLTAKAALINYRNLPLYINDTTATAGAKGFVYVNESKANNFRISGDIGFDLPKKLSLNAGIIVNGFASLKDNAKPWHVPQMEVKASASYWVKESLLLKADLWSFTGSSTLLGGNIEKKTGGGNDLSFGAEYKINKKFSAWASINNLTNNQYQRWYNYPVYGTNFIGGIIVRF